jgi:N-acyl-L-homoserine lactone synthetase
MFLMERNGCIRLERVLDTNGPTLLQTFFPAVASDKGKLPAALQKYVQQAKQINPS